MDLGAGTGSLTKQLAGRQEGYDILAIEPHEAMRKELEAKKLKGVSVLAGFADKLPLQSQSVDALVASQVTLSISYTVVA